MIYSECGELKKAEEAYKHSLAMCHKLGNQLNIGLAQMNLGSLYLKQGLVDEDSITVQLTPHGDFQMLYVEKIETNEIYVLNEADEGIDCFYIVHG